MSSKGKPKFVFSWQERLVRNVRDVTIQTCDILDKYEVAILTELFTTTAFIGLMVGNSVIKPAELSLDFIQKNLEPNMTETPFYLFTKKICVYLFSLNIGLSSIENSLKISEKLAEKISSAGFAPKIANQITSGLLVGSALIIRQALDSQLPIIKVVSSISAIVRGLQFFRTGSIDIFRN